MKPLCASPVWTRCIPQYKLGACDLGVDRKFGRNGVAKPLQGKYVPFSPAMPVHVYASKSGETMRVSMAKCDNRFSDNLPRAVPHARGRTRACGGRTCASCAMRRTCGGCTRTSSRSSARGGRTRFPHDALCLRHPGRATRPGGQRPDRRDRPARRPRLQARRARRCGLPVWSTLGR